MERREDLTAATVAVAGAGGDEIEAYLARPWDDKRHGGVVVIHHLPGYDEATREMTRRFAAHGYLAVCPNLYSRDAPGLAAEQAAAHVRAQGGVADDRLVGDVAGALAFLKSLDASNGRGGTIGYCSGGRQSFLAACSLALDAAVDCYGAFVAKPPRPSVGLKARPILHLAENLSCPMLGLFGAEDHNPAPEETTEMARVLEGLGKSFEFHTLPDAGHAFFATDRPAYRPAAAEEGWRLVWDFFGRYLN